LLNVATPLTANSLAVPPRTPGPVIESVTAGLPDTEVAEGVENLHLEGRLR